MIEYRSGNIFQSDAEALVNTVNCVGVMGRGLALQFKKAYPENFRAYAAACKKNEVRPGRMFVYETGALGSPRLIINFPTKRHWRDRSLMADIESGLRALAATVRERKIASLAVPPLGSGLGGLDWTAVRPRIEETMRALPDVRVQIFEPKAASAAEKPSLDEAARLTPGRAALIGLMRRYLAGFMDPFVSPLEAQKLMYFMQEAGQPLRLRFRNAAHGPVADNLGSVLDRMAGRFIRRCEGGDGVSDGGLELLPGATEEAERCLRESPETRRRLERVGELMDGFESPFGLELLAAVHWVMTREAAHAPEQVLAAVHESDADEPRFSERQIRVAMDALADGGWV